MSYFGFASAPTETRDARRAPDATAPYQQLPSSAHPAPAGGGSPAAVSHKRHNVALAIQKADLAGLQAMRAAGVDFDAWRDARGCNAAIRATELTDLQKCKPVLHFLQACGVDWNAPDARGQTCAHHAAARGGRAALEVIRHLAVCGADLLARARAGRDAVSYTHLTLPTILLV